MAPICRSAYENHAPRGRELRANVSGDLADPCAAYGRLVGHAPKESVLGSWLAVRARYSRGYDGKRSKWRDALSSGGCDLEKKGQDKNRMM